MRNLKKALALFLVFVTVFALSVSTGAAYTDQSKINSDYEGAVNLLSAIKVVNGKAGGQFDPTGKVTRAEMAKMIYVAANGEDDGAVVYAKFPTKFNDFKGADWATNYIKWANSENIVAGTSAATFRPMNNVTGVQAAKMVLTMMGFKSDIEGYQNVDGWEFNIAKDAQKYGLLKSLPTDCLNRELTREEAAKMIENGLKGKTPVYTTTINPATGEKQITIQGVEGQNMLSKVFELEETKATLLKTPTFGLGGVSEQTHDKKDTVVVKIGNENPTTLVGTAPASLVGQEVTVYYKKSGSTNLLYDLSATGATVTTVVTNGNALKTDAGKKITVSLSDAYLDGKKMDAVKDATDKVMAGNTATYFGKTENGETTYTMLSVITEEIAKVSAYDTVKGTMTAGSISAGSKIADVSGAANVRKDDMVLITKTLKSGTAYTYSVKKASSVEGTISQIRGGKYTINGKSYAASAITGADASSAYTVNAKGTFFLDSCGNIAKLDSAIQAPKATYAMVYEVQPYSIGSVLSGGTRAASAYVMLQDGTVGVLEIAAVGTTEGNSKITDQVLTGAGLKSAKSTAPVLAAYTLTSDGKIKFAAAVPGSEGQATVGADYAKGASVMKIGSDNLLINDDTVVFVKTSGDAYKMYTAYIGKGKIPAIAKNSTVTKYEKTNTSAGTAVKYMVVEPAQAVTAKAYAVITDIVEKANSKNEVKTFYTLFDGKTATEYEASAKESVLVGDVVTFTLSGGVVTVAKVTPSMDKVFASAYAAGEYISTAAGGTDVNINGNVTTTMIDKDHVLVMTVTKDSDGNLTGAAGAADSDVVSSRDAIYGAEAGKGNISVITAADGANAGQAVVIILWK